MCEPLFQIGNQPYRPLDLDLSKRQERRTCDRRSVQDVLNEADRRHQDRRFDRKESKQMSAVLDSIVRNARALEHATLWPFVVTIHGQRDGIQTVLIREVVQAPMHAPPMAEDFVPEGCVVGRADIFPASRFDDMSLPVRARYKAEYEAFLRWRKAHSLGKKPADLVPWEEWDPILQEGRVARWVNGQSA